LLDSSRGKIQGKDAVDAVHVQDWRRMIRVCGSRRIERHVSGDRRNAWSWNASGPGTTGAPSNGPVGGPDCEDGVASYADVSTDNHHPEGLRQTWRAGHGRQVDLSYPLHSRHLEPR